MMSEGHCSTPACLPQREAGPCDAATSQRQLVGAAFAGVIYVAQNLPVGTWVEQLELIAKASAPEDLAGALLPLR